MNNEELIKRLNFENWVWIVFAVISLLSVYGDELIKHSILCNDSRSQEKAQNLFFVILMITLGIYVYFFLRNYADLAKHRNETPYQVRFLSSILLVVAILCLLYFQIETTAKENSSSIRF